VRGVRPVVPGARPLGALDRASLALEILAAYAVVRWQLARREFPQALAALRGTRAHAVHVDDPRLAGLRLGNAVIRVLGALPADSRCLMRSLVLLRLLRRRGIDGRLLLGVSGRERFAAHAWVEHDRRPLLPTGGDAFQRLAEL
jgi:hypothetical protein